MVVSGCGFGRTNSELLERERLKFGATNDLRALEELRRQLAREEEIVEIYLSELDRARDVEKQLQRRIDQQRGQVSVLETNARKEKEKADALAAQVEESRKRAAALEAELEGLNRSLEEKAARRDQLREGAAGTGDPAEKGSAPPPKQDPPPVEEKGGGKEGDPKQSPDEGKPSASARDGRS